MWHCDNRETIVIKISVLLHRTRRGVQWRGVGRRGPCAGRGELIYRACHCESEGLCMKQA